MKLNKDQQEQFYNEIMEIYDLAEGIINKIENAPAGKREKEFILAQPIVQQINDSTGMILDSYLECVETDGKKKNSKMIEDAIRGFFSSVERMILKLEGSK